VVDLFYQEKVQMLMAMYFGNGLAYIWCYLIWFIDRIIFHGYDHLFGIILYFVQLPRQTIAHMHAGGSILGYFITCKQVLAMQYTRMQPLVVKGFVWRWTMQCVWSFFCLKIFNMEMMIDFVPEIAWQLAVLLAYCICMDWRFLHAVHGCLFFWHNF